MPEGTTFPFSKPHTYDSLTNDYYCGHTILHPSHVASKGTTRVWRPVVMLSVSDNVYSEIWAIQLSPEQSAQLHLCHFLQFSLMRFKKGNRKHCFGIKRFTVCSSGVHRGVRAPAPFYLPMLKYPFCLIQVPHDLKNKKTISAWLCPHNANSPLPLWQSVHATGVHFSLQSVLPKRSTGTMLIVSIISRSLITVPWVVAVCSLGHLKAEVVSFSHLPFIASLSKFVCVPQGCLDLNDVFLLDVSWWAQVLFGFVL